MKYYPNIAKMTYHNNDNAYKNGVAVYGKYVSYLDLKQLTVREAEEVFTNLVGVEKYVNACKFTDLINEFKCYCKR